MVSSRGEERLFLIDAYLLGQKGCRLLLERPHVAIRCSLVICEASSTSVPTQPHAEDSFPDSLFRFSCSPAARPFGEGEARRFLFGAMKSRGKKERACVGMGEEESELLRLVCNW